MSYAVFVIIFLFIANRHVVGHAFERIARKRIPGRRSANQKLLDLVYIKTGLRLPHFWVYDTHDFWGMMAGIPGKPQMFISTYALYTFSDDEMDWLLLHESGHYVLNHTIKEAVYQLLLIGTGVFALWQFDSVYLAVALGILFGAMGVQLGKHHEFEAELYALSRVTNPQGMIESGVRGVQKWHKPRGIITTLGKKLFNRWESSMHLHRIHQATHEIALRKRRSRSQFSHRELHEYPHVQRRQRQEHKKD